MTEQQIADELKRLESEYGKHPKVWANIAHHVDTRLSLVSFHVYAETVEYNSEQSQVELSQIDFDWFVNIAKEHAPMREMFNAFVEIVSGQVQVMYVASHLPFTIVGDRFRRFDILKVKV